MLYFVQREMPESEVDKLLMKTEPLSNLYHFPSHKCNGFCGNLCYTTQERIPKSVLSIIPVCSITEYRHEDAFLIRDDDSDLYFIITSDVRINQNGEGTRVYIGNYDKSNIQNYMKSLTDLLEKTK